jgi:hypothetical protein
MEFRRHVAAQKPGRPQQLAELAGLVARRAIPCFGQWRSHDPALARFRLHPAGRCQCQPGHPARAAGGRRGSTHPPRAPECNSQIALSSDGQRLYSAASNALLPWRRADGVLLLKHNTEVLSPSFLAASPRGDAFGLGRADAVFIVARKPDFFLPLLPPQNGSMNLTFSGVPGLDYALEAFTELLNWVSGASFSCSNSPASVSVTLAAFARQFYRLSRE